MNRQPSSYPRDLFADLLRETRGLPRERAGAREQWLRNLPVPHKDERLFELEMLLKGLGCFANARNQAGLPRPSSAMARDFRPELEVVRDALDGAIGLTRMLLGDRERTFTFTRYLESVLPEDAARTQLVQEQLAQNTPEESLSLVRNSFSELLELANGLLRLPRVHHRQHQALLGSVIREIGRNAHFNPLVALEFRPEFDRIHNGAVLDALRAVSSESGHRVAALAFLTLFRALHYLDLVERYAASPSTTRRGHVVLAAFRSDVRALARFLEQRAAAFLASGLESELLAVRAEELAGRRAELVGRAEQVRSLRAALQTLARTLRTETAAVFEHELAAPGAEASEVDLGLLLGTASVRLRDVLRHAVRTLCEEIRPGAPPPDLGEGPHARSAVLERRRKETWMFLQVLRAFVAKARASEPADDAWHDATSLGYVREFVEHYRILGHRLTRTSDYAGLEELVGAVSEVARPGAPCRLAVTALAAQCERLFAHLEARFASLSDAPELQRTPFDRRAAALAMRRYLGSGAS